MGCGASTPATPAPEKTTTTAPPPATADAAAPAWKPAADAAYHRITKITIKPGSITEIRKVVESDAFKEVIKSFVGFIGVEALSVDDMTMLTHSRWVSEEACEGGAAAFKAAMGQIKEHLAAPPDAPWIGPDAMSLTIGGSGTKTAYRVVIMEMQEGKQQAMIDFATSKVPEFKAIDGLVDITSFMAGPTTAVVCAGYITKAQLEAATPTIMPIMKEMLGTYGAGPPTMFTTEVEWTTFDFSAAIAREAPAAEPEPAAEAEAAPEEPAAE